MIGSLIQTIMILIGFIFFIVLIIGIVSPFEPLGWFSKNEDVDKDLFKKQKKVKRTLLPKSVKRVIIYLSGIGAVSGDRLLIDEEEFVSLLRKDTTSHVIGDIFPYSMTNNGLNGQRAFAPFWNWINSWHYKNNPTMEAVITSIVNIRNLFQVLVSADYRYGPVYDAGIAQVIIDGLLRHGYDFSSKTPIILIGWSGGGQISMSATAYLHDLVEAPIRVIMLGGAMLSDGGLPHIKRLDYVYGNKDPFPKLIKLAPPQWTFMNSNWNFGIKTGMIHHTEIEDMGHNGPTGYFGFEPYPHVKKKVRYVDYTISVLNKLIAEEA